MNPGFTQAASLQRSRISVARPRKLRKPITSVTVVRITAPASAGSNPMRLTVSGTSTPPSAAEQKLIVNAEPITSDSGRSRYQIQTITPSSEPSDRPFIIATRTSFHSSVRALELPERQRGGEGKSVAVRVEIGGRGVYKKK